MKKNRDNLEKAIYSAIDKNLVNRRTIINKITSDLSENHNISAGKIKMIYNKSEGVPIQALSNAELFVFTRALYKATNDYNINPEDWFNPEEIKSYELYKAQTYSKGDVAVFYNVDQVSENQWVCTKETWVDMSKKLNQGLITYNIRTQRETTTVTFGNIETQIPTIKMKPVQDMTELILNGKFTPNMITLNIRKTESNEQHFEYDAKTRTLSIAVDNETTFLDIPDGMHRTLSGARAVEINPNLTSFTMINILNYTEEEAQQYIEQEDHRTPINPSHIASFKNDDNGVMMAKHVNKFGNEKNNEMFNTLATNINEFNSSNIKYTTIEMFARAFNHNWKINQPREFAKIQKFMISFFNECIGIIREKHLDQSKYLASNVFIGYIALSSILFKKENWVEILEVVVDRIASDESFEKLGLHSDNLKVTLPLLRKFSDYFKKIGVDLI